MTEGALIRRTFRQANQKEVESVFAQTRAGQKSRPAQIKAAAKKLLMNYTAKVRREEATKYEM